MEKETITIIFTTGIVITVSTILILIIIKINIQKANFAHSLHINEINHLKRISAIQTEAYDNERMRIGALLHDDLGQHLTLIQMKLSKFDNTQINNNEFNDIINSTKIAIEKCANISKNLYPVILLKLGLHESLKELIHNLKKSTSIEIKYNNTLTQVSLEIGNHILRIIQELLNNSIKHSKAKNIWINLFQENSHIKLTYQDDGIGFNTQNKNIGIGLNSIESRVISMNSQFEINSQIDHGFTFKLRIPNEKN